MTLVDGIKLVLWRIGELSWRVQKHMLINDASAKSSIVRIAIACCDVSRYRLKTKEAYLERIWQVEVFRAPRGSPSRGPRVRLSRYNILKFRGCVVRAH